ncbi:MAG: class I SAM-dependent methyltransferase [Vicinamibacterales bacterium]
MSLLERLMAASGPGVAAGRVSEDAWREFVERVVEKLDVGPGTTVFDVRCGAGAFQFPLAENGYLVGGIDPSPALVAQATAAMPNGRWMVGEATTLDPGEPWDVVVAVSAFRTFKDLDEARGVLARMMAKATHAIAVLDVPDADAPGSDPESHGSSGLQYDRDWVLHTLAEMGVSAVQIEDQRLDGDPLAAARFNVFARI